LHFEFDLDRLGARLPRRFSAKGNLREEHWERSDNLEHHHGIVESSYCIGANQRYVGRKTPF
jgi:hypothetical protein